MRALALSLVALALLSFTGERATADGLELSPNPIQLTGHAESIRTVWFSRDGKSVYGDYNDIVKWQLSPPRLTFKTPIGGYQTNPSFVSPDGTVWVQGNSSYDDAKKRDISKMHSTLATAVLDGAVQTHKLGNLQVSIGLGLPDGQAIVALHDDGRVKVVTLDLATATPGDRVYLDGHSKAWKGAVVTTLALSPDQTTLAVGLAGKKKGVVLFQRDSGKQLKRLLQKTISVDQAPSVLVFDSK